MSQQRLLISVYDKEIDKTIIEEKAVKESADILKIPYKTLYNSINRNTLIKKRYLVVSVGEIIKEEKPKKQRNDLSARELLQFKCDDVIEAARRLRNGGKIVCKGGKKYVEGGFV